MILMNGDWRCICTLYSGKQHPGKEIVFLHGISFQTKYTLLDILSLLPDGALFNLDVLMESVLLYHLPFVSPPLFNMIKFEF